MEATTPQRKNTPYDKSVNDVVEVFTGFTNEMEQTNEEDMFIKVSHTIDAENGISQYHLMAKQNDGSEKVLAHFDHSTNRQNFLEEHKRYSKDGRYVDVGVNDVYARVLNVKQENDTQKVVPSIENLQKEIKEKDSMISSLQMANKTIIKEIKDLDSQVKNKVDYSLQKVLQLSSTT